MPCCSHASCFLSLLVTGHRSYQEEGSSPCSASHNISQLIPQFSVCAFPFLFAQSIRNGTLFRYVVLDDAADAEPFTQPLALQKLALFLADAVSPFCASLHCQFSLRLQAS